MIPGSHKHPPIFDSFCYAFNGIRTAIKGERNIKIMIGFFIAMIAVAIWLQFDIYAWIVLLLASGCTFAAELLNTAIEEVVDLVCPRMDEKAGRAKDIAAGAVLALSIACAIVGLLLIWRAW